MSEDDDAPRPRRRRTVAAAVLVVLLVALLALWIARRDLARGYADDLLAAKGVPARYTIADLGLGGQRLTGVVLGDPARPDLTADWVETDTRMTLAGPALVAIRAGRVRLHGRVIAGRVRLGALDRLLPASNGAAFALPDLNVAVADGRMRLDTPVGAVGMKFAGSGNLLDGFDGTLAAVAPVLRSEECTAVRASGYWRITVRDRAPHLTGPTRAATIACGEWQVRDLVAVVDTGLSPALDRIDGTTRLALGEVRSPRVWLKQVTGTLTAKGRLDDASGTLALTTGPAAALGASATRVRLAGRYRAGPQPGFEGRLDAEHASLPARWRGMAAGVRGSAAGTPAGPLLDRAAAALALAGRDATAGARLILRSDDDGWHARVAGLDWRSASGAALALSGEGVSAGPAGVTADAVLTLAGGGVPAGTVSLRQAAPGAPLIGTARFATYRAGTASLALTPVTFRATPGGRTAFATRVTLSGPLGDGRVDGARLALTGGWDGRGRLVLNPGCAPAGFDRLRIAGLALDRASFALCPSGRALVTFDRGVLGGGARIAAPRLTGTLGGSPVTIAASGSELRFDDGGLAVAGLALRVGTGARTSRLDVARLTGRIAGGGVAGSYAGGAGRIGAVPLLLSDASGGWRLAGGVLALDGAMTVSDAAADPRFKPLAARAVALRLADGIVRANGTLVAPGKDVKVADVTIVHRLGDGTGRADLAVPRIAFGDRIQPTDLTRLTLGVVADVRGTVTGAGRIDWTPRGVTSTGTFRTARTDLAAAFGPVTGLKGEIRFTDLLALESAPDQVATVASINPGVPVDDGVIHYRLLAGPKIQVDSAVWPFAGGTLSLRPTLLDYSRPVEKRLTFRVEGLDAAVFLRSFDYKNLSASGVFDGNLPMIFDERGGRIEDGKLDARSGGTLAYVGEVSQENLGVWGNLAFGALKSLKYRQLGLTLNGPLEGEMVTIARFGGVAQGEGAKSNFVIRRLAKLPFVFNIKITAPFRGLIDAARGFYDPQFLIKRDLPGLLQRDKAVQQPASAPVPERKQD